MDKSRSILHEGYVYKEEKNGQVDVVYFVLKPNALCFYRRKVHRRHTPVGRLKLEEICVETEECTRKEMQSDCNSNYNRFSWQIIAQKGKLFLYCGTLEERCAWLTAIQAAQKDLSNDRSQHASCDFKKPANELHQRSNLNAEKQQQVELALKSPSHLDTDPTHSKSIYHCSHTDIGKDNSVGNGDSSNAVDDKPRSRLRSRSLSELINSNDFADHETYLRFLKSNSTPPEGGNSRTAFKTVDKLIDVHSAWCRQLVRWI